MRAGSRAVLLATANEGKVRELCALLPGLDVVSLRELGGSIALDEPGEDYQTNAVAKAMAASRATGRVALADDSGLEVDALGAAPGWRSARYGGRRGDDAANRARLLAALEGVPAGTARRARFRCAVAVADAEGALGVRVLLGFGECEGRVTLAPRGQGGFGYDPILEVVGLEGTMAELDEPTKNRVSHRARAVGAVLPSLRAYLVGRGA